MVDWVESTQIFAIKIAKILPLTPQETNFLNTAQPILIILQATDLVNFCDLILRICIFICTSNLLNISLFFPNLVQIFIYFLVWKVWEVMFLASRNPRCWIFNKRFPVNIL